MTSTTLSASQNHPLRQDTMTDPRNVAHDKKVQQEKAHQGIENAPDAINTPQPGKKPPLEHHKSDTEVDAGSAGDGEQPKA
jgi:hypothetical protein